MTLSNKLLQLIKLGFEFKMEYSEFDVCIKLTLSRVANNVLYKQEYKYTEELYRTIGDDGLVIVLGQMEKILRDTVREKLENNREK